MRQIQIDGSNRIQINGLTIETDGQANIQVRDGKVFINGKHFSKLGNKIHNVTIKGNIKNLDVTGDATVEGNIDGDIQAGGDIKCGDVSGSITAGGDVSAKNAKQNIQAGGDVRVSKD